MLPVALVEHHVENHRDSLLVAEVYEFLVVLRRAVGLVWCEIKVRVITPRVVAVELIDREKLHRIDSEFLEVRDLFDGGADGAVSPGLTLCAGEVSEQHLVDHEVGLCGSLEVRRCPLVIEHAVAVIGKGCVVRNLVGGVFRKSRKNISRDILVILRVEHKPCVGVAHGGTSLHQIIIAELAARDPCRKSGLEEPEGVSVDVGVDIFHHIAVGGAVTVPASHQHHALLARCRQTERGGAVGVAGEAHCRHRGVGGRRGVSGVDHRYRPGQCGTAGDCLRSHHIVAGSGERVIGHEALGRRSRGHRLVADPDADGCILRGARCKLQLVGGAGDHVGNPVVAESKLETAVVGIVSHLCARMAFVVLAGMEEYLCIPGAFR